MYLIFVRGNHCNVLLTSRFTQRYSLGRTVSLWKGGRWSCNRTQEYSSFREMESHSTDMLHILLPDKSTSRQLDIAQLDQERKYERRDQKATSISTLSDKKKDFHQPSEWELGERPSQMVFHRTTHSRTREKNDNALERRERGMNELTLSLSLFRLLLLGLFCSNRTVCLE